MITRFQWNGNIETLIFTFIFKSDHVPNAILE